MSTVYRGKKFYEEAIAWNKANAIAALYFSSYPVDSKEFAQDVSDFQKSKDLKVDGKCGPTTIAHIRQDFFDKLESLDSVTNLDRADYDNIATIVSKFEGNYWSMNRDGEFKGLFDRPGKKHWASGKVHIGLSFGYIQFTQDGGALGDLLKRMHKDDPRLFEEVFGPHYLSLLEITNRPKGERSNGRSQRVQKVGGHDLWHTYWTKRFNVAGKHKPWQKLQRDMAVEQYMMPAIKTCKELNIRSERGLAIVFDRSVQYGPSGAKKLLKRSLEDLPEHLRLRELLDKWSEYRWSHRTKAIYQSILLKDSICAFM